MIAGYEHFLALAARLAWDAEAIDLRADAGAWRALAAAERERLAALVAGFCLGEARVAETLAPFGAAAGDPAAAACFAAQARDEARHARFFDRVAAEVAAVGAATPEARRAVMAPRVDPTFAALFETRLPALSEALAAGRTDLGSAVGLYHMVLEGVVFTAGLLALLELLDDRPELPGLRRGVALVLRDERWHVGFGARCLQDAGLDAAGAAAILAEGERAAGAWAHAAGAAIPAHVLATLRRRLVAAAGIQVRGPGGREKA